VALLEEMPVQETLDGLEELKKADLPVGAVFVNMLQTEELSQTTLQAGGEVSIERLQQDLESVGVAASTQLVESLAGEAVDHATRVALQRRERERLSTSDAQLIDLPFLPDGVDLGGLYELANRIREEAPR